jgi:hypothetical protein
MKNKLLKILPWILLIVSIYLIFVMNNKEVLQEVPQELSKEQLLIGGDIASATRITCNYPQVVSAYYMGDNAKYSITKKETNPLIFTFSNFENELAELSYLDSSQAITTVPLVKLVDNSEKLTFIDGDGSNYLTIHTIYKNKGISSYTKQVDLLGTPSTAMSMGACKISF